MPERVAVPRGPAETMEAQHTGGLLAAAGAVLAAFGAALCCVGPILFVTFGVGAGLASTFEPLRPLFTALAVLGLGFGFYTVYARPRRRAVPVRRASARGTAAEIRSCSGVPLC